MLSHDDYTVAWISALPLELAAASKLLDDLHADLPLQQNDHNVYTFGRIGKHNVVIACMPSGEYGITSAAAVAMQLLSSFKHIRFGLMVGIGGGVPDGCSAIRLGDVVVSKPIDIHGGVVQYDYGKALQGGDFVRTGMLNRPPQVLLTALSKLQAAHLTDGSRIIEFLGEIDSKVKQQPSIFTRPSRQDVLFDADYPHVPSSPTCEKCDAARQVIRLPRGHAHPIVHYGLIGSGNKVVRDASLRRKLADGLGVLCLEMEAAGLMNYFPCIAIRGICDYADSHKNEVWQGYAAAVAAAYAKELILTTPVTEVVKMTTVRGALDQITTQISSMSPFTAPIKPTALHDASASGNIQKALSLIKSGAEIEAQDTTYMTPLMVAIKNNDTAMVTCLIDNGARLDIPVQSWGTPLHVAINKQDKEMVSLLLARGSDANMAGAWGTPLQVAIKKRDNDIISLLLARGSDVNMAGLLDRLPLQDAVETRKPELVELLLRNNASPNPDLAVRWQDKTLLHVAVSNRSPQVVALLLEYGADATAEDMTGRTPLESADDRMKSVFYEAAAAKSKKTHKPSDRDKSPRNLEQIGHDLDDRR